MSEVYDDIMASLNELMDAAQGKETGVVRHEGLAFQQEEERISKQKAKRLFVKKTEEFNALEEANKRVAQQISDLQDRMLSDLESIEVQEKLLKDQKAAYEKQVCLWDEH